MKTLGLTSSVGDSVPHGSQQLIFPDTSEGSFNCVLFKCLGMTLLF